MWTDLARHNCAVRVNRIERPFVFKKNPLPPCLTKPSAFHGDGERPRYSVDQTAVAALVEGNLIRLQLRLVTGGIQGKFVDFRRDPRYQRSGSTRQRNIG